jgi:rfaE bifunctional protein nucleotidyltransferase chain/domain
MTETACPDAINISGSLQRKTFETDSENLQILVSNYRKQGLTLAHCHGVFDLLHIGHIRHFKEAKALGDILIVSVTADQYVNKGPGRPRFTETLRAEALASLEYVDVVVINDNPTAIEVINVIKPNFYIKGEEYQFAENDITGKIVDERNAVEAHGGKIVYTHDITFSSSSLINEYFSPYPPEVMDYLKSFKSRYSVDDVMNCIDALQDLSVLVIGETIIDEYVFCDAIGKAGKEPVLVSKYNRQERYAGGILAVANHAKDFCKNVTCLTYLGEGDDELKFIKQHLKQGVTLEHVEKLDSPTIVKTRYLEEYSGQKLFEMYQINDNGFVENKKKFSERLESLVPQFDVVIVADYGHGLIDADAIEYLSKHAKFLAVNTQANAGNHGFNCIEKYPRADYVSIAHRELTLTIRDKSRTAEEGLKYLLDNRDYRSIMVTKGIGGSITYKSSSDFCSVPAFATTVKDRVGAGDSVLAITSLCMAKDQPAEIIGLIGNMVGAQAVNIMGNKSFIEKVGLKKFISHSLK